MSGVRSGAVRRLCRKGDRIGSEKGGRTNLHSEGRVRAQGHCLRITTGQCRGSRNRPVPFLLWRHLRKDGQRVNLDAEIMMEIMQMTDAQKVEVLSFAKVKVLRHKEDFDVP